MGLKTCHSYTCNDGVQLRKNSRRRPRLADIAELGHQVHVVVLNRTAKKCTKIYNALAQLLFYSLNLLFGGILVAVIVVVCLGADHLTLEEGGGGGKWVILKKNFLQALVGRKKLYTAQMKKNKNSCAAAGKKKKMLQTYFIIPGGLYKIPAKLQPFRIICKPASHSG